MLNKAKNRFQPLELAPCGGSAKITRLDLSRFACSGTLPEIQPGGVPERDCGTDVCDMATFVRESVANDDSDDDHITLSLGCLDTESDNALDLDNLSDVSPRRKRKSIYSPREPRWPPRRSSRECTCRSTQASVSRPPTPPRTKDYSR